MASDVYLEKCRTCEDQLRRLADAVEVLEHQCPAEVFSELRRAANDVKTSVDAVIAMHRYGPANATNGNTLIAISDKIKIVNAW